MYPISHEQNAFEETRLDAQQKKKGGSGMLWLLASLIGVLSLCLCACLTVSAVVYISGSPDQPRRVSSGVGTKPAPGSTRTAKDGMVQISVPEGDLSMGADDGDLDELPVHTVKVDGFWIDQTKVTVDMFSKFASSNAVKGKWSKGSDGHSPVTGVTYADAENYCKAQGLRLPTEAEWERSAKGPDNRRYPWGDDWDPNMLVLGNLNPDDSLLKYDKVWGPVDEVPEAASGWGVLGMAGGPREWTSTFYELYPGAPDQSLVLQKNKYQVTRGGFRPNNYLRDFRTTARDWQLPDLDSLDLGFRCAG
jgi:formylglycine-generating enzyme required for sulfatase activity